ncbi:MAG: tetratricopeptide repeat protein [Acidobacteriota bacterium]|nr:tetratricopeptide repeat protein [Acidobacteriota bacterium]
MTGHKQRNASPLFEALDQELRRRPYGTISAMERALGWSTGWWHGRIRAGDVSTRHMLAILDFLGLDPVAFVRRQVGSSHGLELDRPLGEAPEIVDRAWERFRSGEEGPGVGATFLQSLDRKRYTDPAGTLSLAEGAVSMVELELLPQLLGVAGSSLRHLWRLEEAASIIHCGLELAAASDDVAALGSLLQRMGYVVAATGDLEEALRLADAAATHFLRTGQHRALGPALIDRGIWLYNLGRYEESIQIHSAALELLAEEQARNRITGLEYKALCYRELGDFDLAQEYLRQARAEPGEAAVWAKPKLDWFEGQLLCALGEYDRAAELLEAASVHFRQNHLGEAAMISCDLIRARLLQRHYAEAYQAAQEMLVLLEPLRNNKVISAAIADMLRNGQAGLTLALVEEASSNIANLRQHRLEWRRLRVTS